MIYGCRRMIYLLRKHDIISVPFIRKAYIICAAYIIPGRVYHPFPKGTDIIAPKKSAAFSCALFWCERWDSNPHGVTTRTSNVLVYHSNTLANA